MSRYSIGEHVIACNFNITDPTDSSKIKGFYDLRKLHEYRIDKINIVSIICTLESQVPYDNYIERMKFNDEESKYITGYKFTDENHRRYYNQHPIGKTDQCSYSGIANHEFLLHRDWVEVFVDMKKAISFLMYETIRLHLNRIRDHNQQTYDIFEISKANLHKLIKVHDALLQLKN